MPKKKKARRPAKGTFTYYRLSLDGKYLQDEPPAGGAYGPASSARLFPSRPTQRLIKGQPFKIEPVRVVTLRSAKRNKKRTR